MAISIQIGLHHTLYVGTDQGPAFSSDLGASWTNADPTEGDASAFGYSVTVDPNFGRKLFAATLGATAMISDNDGVSWTPAGTDYAAREPRKINVDPADSNRVYSGSFFSGLIKSTDGGTTWSRRTLGSGYAYVWVPVVDPVSPNIIWAGTSGEGTNTQRIYVGSEACGCVYKSTDGGDSWFSVSDGLENTVVFGLDQDPRRPGLLFVTGPGGIFKTTTGGE